MRIAAISDVHGNLPALEAVLADIAGARVDMRVNLGDLVSGPLSVAETAELLWSLELPTVRGNHERQLLAAGPDPLGASEAYAASKLSDRHWRWLASLPETLLLAKDVFSCPRKLRARTPTTCSRPRWPASTLDPMRHHVGLRPATLAEAAERAGSTLLGTGGLILCGHSHWPRVLQLLDGRLIVNPGSVGLPAYEASRSYRHIDSLLPVRESGRSRCAACLMTGRRLPARPTRMHGPIGPWLCAPDAHPPRLHLEPMVSCPLSTEI